MKTILLLFLAWLPIVGLAWLSEVSALAASNQVKCLWEPNTEPDIAGYRVLLGTNSQHYTFTNTVLGRLTTNTIVSVSPGISYVVVRAFTDGGVEGSLSYEVLWTNAPVVIPPFLPVPPKKFRVEATIQSASSTNGPWRNLAQMTVSLPPGGEKENYRTRMLVEEGP